MFKRRGQISENKNQKSKRLWGKDFSIVKDGLDEKQVVSFVNDLVKQNESSSPSSVRSVLKSAIVEAEQIVSNIKMKAQAEADEETARIIAQAEEEAEKIKGEPVIEVKAEDISSAATGEVKAVATEAEPEVVEERVEELIQLLGETAEEKTEVIDQLQKEVPAEKAGETVQIREEAIVTEPAEAKVEEILEPQLPEEKLGGEETEPVSIKQDGHSLYTGEVEIDVARPVEPKVVSKLYNYLQTTPEIKFVRTSGSWDRGTTITVVLDKPVSLISVLSAKIPEAIVTPERPEMGGFVKGRRGLRRIRLALKEG